MRKILLSLINIATKAKEKNGELLLKIPKNSNNRIQSVGESLEEFIKLSFFNWNDNKLKYNEEEGVFSYIGNKNNPPDLMLKEEEAIEIKKISSPLSDLALNSSYPKSKLYKIDPMITEDCRIAEEWREKDLIYIIGYVKENKLKYLFLIDGPCYCAKNKLYENIKDRLQEGIKNIPNLDFWETKELGKIKKVDPLGITTLRIRGMWHIENPLRFFTKSPYVIDTIINIKERNKSYNYFEFFYITNKPLTQEEKIILQEHNIKFENIKIPDPNNPAKNIDTILLTFYI